MLNIDTDRTLEAIAHDFGAAAREYRRRRIEACRQVPRYETPDHALKAAAQRGITRQVQAVRCPFCDCFHLGPRRAAGPRT